MPVAAAGGLGTVPGAAVGGLGAVPVAAAGGLGTSNQPRVVLNAICLEIFIEIFSEMYAASCWQQISLPPLKAFFLNKRWQKKNLNKKNEWTKHAEKNRNTLKQF